MFNFFSLTISFFFLLFISALEGVFFSMGLDVFPTSGWLNLACGVDAQMQKFKPLNF